MANRASQICGEKQHRFLHDREPGCAIREAVQRGEISLRRYKSMLKLSQE